ncbi:hypothetical protein Clacol_006148 [Clathrus columnatus]|uniref:HMG box domain-containing protein n=1 Tax=Clathrus columnatus TaxID=1419009 RepID=A0AAV5AC34_9AGAM|nr:hypothetical protein Clacol_006148 [Clathrus columnatus]
MTRTKSRTAGQLDSNVSLPPNELEGWTSQALPRRTSGRSIHKARFSVTRARRTYKPYPLFGSSTSKKKNEPNYIPRPPNKFILFRHYFTQDCMAAADSEDRGAGKSKYLSKASGEAWKALSEAEQNEWDDFSKELCRLHALRYPDYRYRPKRPNARSRTRSNEERQIEESSVTFHSSAENSPDPGFCSLVTNDDAAAAATVPIVNNTFPTVTLDSRFIQRKQSLRLSNWDDSVLYPQDLSLNSNFLLPPPFPYSNSSIPIPPHQGESSANLVTQQQQQSWNLDALQRRSSSAPIPLPNMNTTVLPPPSYNNDQGNIPGPSHYPHTYPSSRRLSYSGIRPGFTFQNMGSFMGSSSTQGQTALSGPPPQVQVINPEEPPHEIFGNYRITYPEVNVVERLLIINFQNNNNSNPNLQPWPNTTTNPAMFVSPIQEIPPTQHLNTSENNLVPPNWSFPHSPAKNVYNAPSPSPLPVGDHRGTSTNANNSGPTSSNFPSSPMLSFEEFVAINNKPGDLLDQVESIRFDVPAPAPAPQIQAFRQHKPTAEKQKDLPNLKEKKGKAKQMALGTPRQVRELRQQQPSRSTRTRRTVSPLPNNNTNINTHAASTPETVITHSQRPPTSVPFEDPVMEKVNDNSNNGGSHDANFIMNLDPALLSVTPEDPFIDFYANITRDDDVTDFDSTWDLFNEEAVIQK